MNTSLKSHKLPLYKDGKRWEGDVLLEDLDGDGDAYPSPNTMNIDSTNEIEVWLERAIMPDGAECLIRYEFSQEDLAIAARQAEGNPVWEYYLWKSAAVAVELI